MLVSDQVLAGLKQAGWEQIDNGMDDKPLDLRPGYVSVTPPETAHFTISTNNLVLAVVNTPSFDPNDAVSITETDASVGFDEQQFDVLKQSAATA